VADVLTGATNPCGKLPISVPRSVGQVPLYSYTTPSGGRSHWTGNYVDAPASPLFPFGHGLSYTTFEYGALEVSPADARPDGQVVVACSVRNSGDRAGTEVVQLYLGYQPEGALVTRPVKQLKGFARVELRAGQRATVRFTLDPRALAFYDLDMQLRLYPGTVKVMVGSSSADIRLEGAFRIRSVAARVDAAKRAFFTKADAVLG
jgi:beta-glucosidase